jgi:hypothetical protein
MWGRGPGSAVGSAHERCDVCSNGLGWRAGLHVVSMSTQTIDEVRRRRYQDTLAFRSEDQTRLDYSFNRLSGETVKSWAVVRVLRGSEHCVPR